MTRGPGSPFAFDAFEKIGKRNFEASCDLGQIEEGHVTPTSFDGRQVGAIHADAKGEVFLTYTLAITQVLDAHARLNLELVFHDWIISYVIYNNGLYTTFLDIVS